MVDILTELDRRMAVLDNEFARRARHRVVVRRLMAIPGLSLITATANFSICRNRRQEARPCRLVGISTKNRCRPVTSRSPVSSRAWESERYGIRISSVAARLCFKRASAEHRQAHGSDMLARKPRYALY